MKSVDTPINILASFAYAGKSENFAKAVFTMADNNEANVMIDCGAFSAFNNKGFNHVTLDNYCTFLDKYADVSQKYVMLDVIGNDAASKKNYEEMLRRGYNPMYVLTMFDKDFAYLGDAVKRNRHICVAGGATVKNDWLVQRYQRVYKSTNSMARIHGLAFVTFPRMLQCNLESVDSSSWAQGATKYGLAQIFTPTGLKGFSQVQLIKAIKAKKKFVTDALDRLKILPKHVLDKARFHTSDSLAFYMSARASMEMQRYAYRRGLRMFLASTNVLQLDCVKYFVEHWDDCSYEQFRQVIKPQK